MNNIQKLFEKYPGSYALDINPEFKGSTDEVAAVILASLDEIADREFLEDLIDD